MIVDASVAVKWFFEEEFADQAWRLRASRAELAAPSIFFAEMTGAVWKRLRKGLISPEIAREINADIFVSLEKIVPIADLAPRAAEIMIDLSHPIYDCLYLALAERERVPLVTADVRLIEAAARLGTLRTLHLADL